MASELRVTTIASNDGSETVDTTYVVNGSAKLWVNFNGTGTPSVSSSLNVGSLTDDGTGIYRVNATSAFDSANHCPSGSNINDSSTANRGSVTLSASGSAASTSSAIAIAAYASSSSSYIDFTDVNLQVMGDLA